MTLSAGSAAAGVPTMGLTFLDPTAGIVAGAIGGGAIVALYFLRLRRRPVRVSSTLLWERATQDIQVNVPLRWITPSWLLLLQLLGLACLAVALARPVARGEWAPSGRVIILLDRSASMGALDGARERTALGANPAPVTRLDEAKRRAAALVRRLDLASGGAEVMVVRFAADASVACSLTRSRGEALAAIEGVAQTDQPGSLVAALELARAFAGAAPGDAGAETPDRAPPATIALFSDGAFGASEGEDAALAGEGVRLERCGPAPAPAPGAGGESGSAGGRDNLGLTAISARRETDDPSAARLFLRVQNARMAEAQAQAVIRVNGEAARAVSLRVPPASADGAPGESTESVRIDAPGLSLIEATLDGEDLLTADDAAALTLPPPGGPSVLLVAPAALGAPGGAAAADGALLRALESLEGARVRALTAEAFDALAGADPSLEGVDLVVFDRVEAMAAPRKPSAHFAAGLGAAGVRIEEAAGESAPRATRALAWSRSAPVMRDVTLDGLLMAGAPALALPPAAVALATGEGGPILAGLEGPGPRRVFIAFDLARSTWWLNPSFAIFIANAVEWLSGVGAEVSGRAILSGEPALVRPAPGAQRIRAVGPTTVEANIAGNGAANSADGAPVSLGLLERVGVYAIEGAAPADRVLAVNLLDATESALATVDPPDAQTGAGGAGAPQAGMHAEQGQREVWRWLLAMGAGLLTIEWWLYAWRSRV